MFCRIISHRFDLLSAPVLEAPPNAIIHAPTPQTAAPRQPPLQRDGTADMHGKAGGEFAVEQAGRKDGSEEETDPK